MNDGRDLIEHADKHGPAVAAFLAAISLITTLLTRRGKVKRAERAEEKARDAEVWDQAGQVRKELKDLLDEAKRRETEMVTGHAKQILDLTDEIADLRKQIYATAVQKAKDDAAWDALVRDLQARPGDEWAHLKIRNGGTKEVPKS